MKNCLTTQVVVIGGGPAGVATAIALQDLGIRVTLIERFSSDVRKFGEHLSPEAIPHLVRLGLLDAVKQCQYLQCSGIKSSWGTNNLLDQDYMFNPYGNGFNLSRASFDAVLLEQATRRGAKVLTGARLSQPERSTKGWYLEFVQAGEHLSLLADLLVDATGRRAWLARKQQSIPVIHDRLIGVVGFVESESHGNSEGNRLILEACTDGWWYSTPLPDNRTVAVFMTDVDIFSAKRLNPQTFWRQQLKTSVFTKERVRYEQNQLEVHVRPAWSQVLNKASGSNWIAVGDAAMSYDPLSSQGISKGLQWGIRVAEIVKQRLSGDDEVFQVYHNNIQETFGQYLQTWLQYYQMEMRWPESVFWKRRHEYNFLK